MTHWILEYDSLCYRLCLTVTQILTGYVPYLDTVYPRLWLTVSQTKTHCVPNIELYVLSPDCHSLCYTHRLIIIKGRTAWVSPALECHPAVWVHTVHSLYSLLAPGHLTPAHSTFRLSRSCSLYVSCLEGVIISYMDFLTFLWFGWTIAIWYS